MKTKICVILIVALAALFSTSAYFIYRQMIQNEFDVINKEQE